MPQTELPMSPNTFPAAANGSSVCFSIYADQHLAAFLGPPSTPNALENISRSSFSSKYTQSLATTSPQSRAGLGHGSRFLAASLPPPRGSLPHTEHVLPQLKKLRGFPSHPQQKPGSSRLAHAVGHLPHGPPPTPPALITSPRQASHRTGAFAPAPRLGCPPEKAPGRFLWASHFSPRAARPDHSEMSPPSLPRFSVSLPASCFP